VTSTGFGIVTVNEATLSGASNWVNPTLAASGVAEPNDSLVVP
jgi:hypothetical protein